MAMGETSIYHSIFALIEFRSPRSFLKRYEPKEITFSKSRSKKENKVYPLFETVRFTRLTVS
jgi:hypothetical protein